MVLSSTPNLTKNPNLVAQLRISAPHLGYRVLPLGPLGGLVVPGPDIVKVPRPAIFRIPKCPHKQEPGCVGTRSRPHFSVRPVRPSVRGRGRVGQGYRVAERVGDVVPLNTVPVFLDDHSVDRRVHHFHRHFNILLSSRFRPKRRSSGST